MSLGLLKVYKFTAAFILIYCLLLTAGCSKSKDAFTPPPIPPLKLTAEVSVFDEKITIINRDTFIWKNPQITITSGGISTFYKISTEDFIAGDRKTYSIDKFVNAAGDVYNIKQQPVSNVVIQVKNEQGKDFGYIHYF